MSKRITHYLYIGVVAIIIATTLSCNTEKKNAERLIETFLQEQLKTGFLNLSFSPLDSTFHLNDSVLNALQVQNRKAFHWNAPAKTGTNEPKKLFMQVKYQLENGRTVKQTFYMNGALTQILAVKED